MSFQNAVQNIPSISGCLRTGLKALGKKSNKIIPTNTRDCNGSIDVDACLRQTNPDSNRWDYVIGYNNRAYFVEVHSASGQVSEVIAKATWLKNWLRSEGEPLAQIHHNENNFYWIPTKGVNILPKDRFRLAQNKVIIVNCLQLP